MSNVIEHISVVKVAVDLSSAVNPTLVNQYVDQYRAFGKKSVSASLELCKVLVEAKEDLVAQDFTAFCKIVGLVEGTSTFSKYKKIGEAYTRFSPHVDILPHGWTSLYMLAQLPRDQFSNVLPSLHPHITASQIAAVLQKRVAAKTEQASPDGQNRKPDISYMVALDEVPHEKLEHIIEILYDLSEFEGFKLIDMQTGSVWPPAAEEEAA